MVAKKSKEIKVEVVEVEDKEVSEVVEEVSENPKKSPNKKMNVEQFCNSHAVTGLDLWVAKRFFPSSKDMKGVREWKNIFMEKKIPYKS